MLELYETLKHKGSKMGLQDELNHSKRKISKDSFDMSVGELSRIYERNEEVIINPNYPKGCFRWDESQTRFIESLLLGILFLYILYLPMRVGDGRLLMALQRLSTIFEF